MITITRTLTKTDILYPVMKILALLCSTIIFLMMLTGNSARAQTVEDSTAIRSAALDYIEGWYTGDVERMDRALDDNLMKRRIQQLPMTGRDLVSSLWKTDMIEYTRAGLGKKQAVEGQTNEVQIMDIFKNIAMVKCVSKDYVDYLQVGLVDGEWKIINVLWAPTKDH